MGDIDRVSRQLANVVFLAAVTASVGGIVSVTLGPSPEWVLDVSAVVFYGAFVADAYAKVLRDSDGESYTPAEHAAFVTCILGLFLFPLAIVAGPTVWTVGTAALVLVTGWIVAALFADTVDLPDDGEYDVPDDPTDILEDGESDD